MPVMPGRRRNPRHSPRPTSTVAATPTRTFVPRRRCRPRTGVAGDDAARGTAPGAAARGSPARDAHAHQSKLPVAVDEQQEQEPRGATPVSGLDLLDSAAAIARLEAQIDKDMVEYSKQAAAQVHRRPHPRVPLLRNMSRTGARRSNALARSTTRGPRAARVYGSLLLSVVIKADGSVDSIEVHRSSGHKGARRGRPAHRAAGVPLRRLPARYPQGHRHHRDHPHLELHQRRPGAGRISHR